jgi:hypothetical protein
MTLWPSIKGHECTACGRDVEDHLCAPRMGWGDSFKDPGNGELHCDLC